MSVRLQGFSDDAEKDNEPGLTERALWSIIRNLKTVQVLSILVVPIGLFSAGYAIGQWVSSASHEREISGLDYTLRQAIMKKDETISVLETALQESKNNTETARQIASNADSADHAYRIKAEFLNRYLSYLKESAENNLAMRELFADHVCALSRDTQSDIFSLFNEKVTFQQVLRGGNLSPAELDALAAVGIDRRTIDEYRQLNQRRSQIDPRTRPTTPGFLGAVDRSRDTQFRRLQQLESSIIDALAKGVTIMSIVFFDGDTRHIPHPVADDVRRRPDCLP
ncbi:MAG: hypothetical protein QNJ84_16520 [Alphaproteobacteria bacterium]|nr:hypothetical protein [Alphaproteobacteria bacterium]